MRTMLTLDVAGGLDEFVPQVFRREPYLARRATYYVDLLASEEPNDMELVAFAEARGWRWGAGARPRATARRAARAARAAAGSVRRRVRPDAA